MYERISGLLSGASENATKSSTSTGKGAPHSPAEEKKVQERASSLKAKQVNPAEQKIAEQKSEEKTEQAKDIEKKPTQAEAIPEKNGPEVAVGPSSEGSGKDPHATTEEEAELRLRTGVVEPMPRERFESDGAQFVLSSPEESDNEEEGAKRVQRRNFGEEWSELGEPVMRRVERKYWEYRKVVCERERDGKYKCLIRNCEVI